MNDYVYNALWILSLSVTGILLYDATVACYGKASKWNV